MVQCCHDPRTVDQLLQIHEASLIWLVQGREREREREREVERVKEPRATIEKTRNLRRKFSTARLLVRHHPVHCLTLLATVASGSAATASHFPRILSQTVGAVRAKGLVHPSPCIADSRQELVTFHFHKSNCDYTVLETDVEPSGSPIYLPHLRSANPRVLGAQNSPHSRVDMCGTFSLLRCVRKVSDQPVLLLRPGLRWCRRPAGAVGDCR